MKHINKYIIYLILGIFVLCGTLYVSYGYMGAKVSGNETAKKFASLSQVLKIEYSGGDESLSTSYDEYFMPGSVITKTFSIKNTGNANINYGIKLIEVENDFERLEDLVYELYLEDTLLITDTFPNYDKVIAYNQTINKGETKNYTLKIIYKESEENQIVDQDKLISAKIDFIQTENSLTTLKLLGNTTQETKELFDSSAITSGFINPSGVHTQSSAAFLSDYIEISTFNKYFISATNKNASANYLRINYYDENKVWQKQTSTLINPSTTYSNTILIDVNSTYKYLRFSFMQDSINTVSFKSSIVSPTNPVEVESVGDRSANLFEYKSPQIANGTIIESFETGAVVQGKSNPTAGDFQYGLGWFRPGNSIAGGNGVVLNEGDVVTISADVTLLEVGVESRKTAIGIHMYSRESNSGFTFGSGNYTELILNNKIRVKKTYTINERYSGETFYPIFCINGHKVKIENIQIAYGNVVDYEPYGKYKIPIKVGSKNIAHRNESYSTKLMKYNVTGSLLTMNGDVGKDSASGNNGGLAYNESQHFVLKANKTYTLSLNYLGGYLDYEGTDAVWIGLRNSSNSWIKAFGIKNSNYKKRQTYTFTPTEDIKAAISFVGWGRMKNLQYGIQVEEGSVATTYEPYVEIASETYNIFLDEPLRKLGSYVDYIDLSNNTIVRKTVKKYLADYTNLGASTEYDTHYVYVARDETILPRYEHESSEHFFGFSNIFNTVSTYDYKLYANMLYMRGWANNIRFAISKNDISDGTVATVRPWLQERNAYMIRIRTEEETNAIELPFNIYSINPDANITVNTTVKGEITKE